MASAATCDTPEWGGQSCDKPHYYDKNSTRTREVLLSGAPRVRDVYVATTYNVRITTQHPTGPYTGRQFSVDRDPAYLACFLVGDGATVSVQGCRYRIQWGRSYCTAWSQFRVAYT